MKVILIILLTAVSLATYNPKYKIGMTYEEFCMKSSKWEDTKPPEYIKDSITRTSWGYWNKELCVIQLQFINGKLRRESYQIIIGYLPRSEVEVIFKAATAALGGFKGEDDIDTTHDKDGNVIMTGPLVGVSLKLEEDTDSVIIYYTE